VEKLGEEGKEGQEDFLVQTQLPKKTWFLIIRV